MAGRPTTQPIAIETDDASITTASITIRALHVGKKQMTQSVFRQLPVANLVEEEAIELTGTPWGWVNYHWGNIDPEVTHFVFTAGTRLFRDPFLVRDSAAFEFRTTSTPPIFRGWQDDYRRLIQALHCCRLLEGWSPPPSRAESATKWNPPYCSKAIMASASVYKLPSDWVLKEEKEGEGDYQKKCRAQAQVELHAIVAENFGDGAHSSDVRREIDALTGVVLDYRRRWDALMDRLREVEQLFIAV